VVLQLNGATRYNSKLILIDGCESASIEYTTGNYRASGERRTRWNVRHARTSWSARAPRITRCSRFFRRSGRSGTARSTRITRAAGCSRSFRYSRLYQFVPVNFSTIILKIWIKGRDGTDGKDGRDGVEGKDGKDGQDGAPGLTGNNL
jgi:hypothetical protein